MLLLLFEYSKGKPTKRIDPSPNQVWEKENKAKARHQKSEVAGGWIVHLEKRAKLP